MRRIVSPKLLRDYARGYPSAEASLDHWEKVVLAARWETPADVQRTFREADLVRVASGRSVFVFNIQHNEHRLIAAIHFNTGMVYVLRLMTHREYSRARWKETL